MTTETLKKKLESLSKSEESPELFVQGFYDMKSNLGLKGNYFDTSVLWVMGKPYRIFYHEDVLFCFQYASGTIRHLGLPVTGSYAKLVEATSVLLELGINLHIGVGDLPEVTSLHKPKILNDNYLYHNCELENYFTEKASRQSRKIHNRLENKYEVVVKKPSEVSGYLAQRITDINNEWIDTFKDGDKYYKLTLNYIENLFKTHTQLDNNAVFLFYKNLETEMIEAYDYIEHWNGVGIAVAGKAVIPKVSSFKHVTVNIVKYAKSIWDCDYVQFGSANLFDMEYKKIHAGNPGLSEAKSSIPHEVVYTNFYKFNQKKYSSVDVADKSKPLF